MSLRRIFHDGSNLYQDSLSISVEISVDKSNFCPEFHRYLAMTSDSNSQLIQLGNMCQVLIVES